MSNLVRFKRKKINVDYYKLYFNAYKKTLNDAIDLYEEGIPRNYITKIVYYGSNLIKHHKKVEYEFQAQSIVDIYNCVKFYISKLTPREFMNIFPIEKSYDGYKWETKDYFSAMRYINNIGIDNEITLDKVDEFLWEYMNIKMDHVTVKALCALSDIRKLQTGKGIMEDFIEECGIPTYTIKKNLKGEDILVQNLIKKDKSYLTVVK